MLGVSCVESKGVRRTNKKQKCVFKDNLYERWHIIFFSILSGVQTANFQIKQFSIHHNKNQEAAGDGFFIGRNMNMAVTQTQTLSTSEKCKVAKVGSTFLKLTPVQKG